MSVKSRHAPRREATFFYPQTVDNHFAHHCTSSRKPSLAGRLCALIVHRLCTGKPLVFNRKSLLIPRLRVADVDSLVATDIDARQNQVPAGRPHKTGGPRCNGNRPAHRV